MKKSMLCVVVPLLWACVFSVRADNWIYDSTAKTLTRGTVVLQNVTANGTNLTIGVNFPNTTATDLDFSVPIDGGWTITSISADSFGRNPNHDQPQEYNPTPTNLVLPATLTFLGNHAFRACTNLTCEIGLMPSNLSCGTTSYGVFYFCSKLHGSIVIPKGWTLTSGNFTGTGIQSVIFEEGATSMTDGFGTDTVGGKTSLTNLYLPSTLKTLGSKTARNCTLLDFDVANFPQNLTSIGDYAFEGATNVHGDLAWPTNSLAAPQLLFSKTAIRSVTAKHGLKTIATGAFASTALEKVVLSYETDTIHVNAFGSSFPAKFHELYFRNCPTNTSIADLGTLRGKMSASFTNYVFRGDAAWVAFAADPNNQFSLPTTQGLGHWGSSVVKYWHEPMGGLVSIVR